MSGGYPKLTRSAKHGEIGVNLVSTIVSDTLGWLFRRNHQEHDFGIDGQIELVTEGGDVTGQMIAAQIKYGDSYFQEQNKWGYIYRGELKHFNYLSNYPLPVVIIICDPVSKECYWAHFRSEQSQITDSGWKMTVPFNNRLSSSKLSLEALVPQARDNLAELQAYWSLNRLIVESAAVLYILGDYDVNTLDVTRPRAFFDRLRATKGLAYECQCKVEFGFSGYDDDPRELFEIEQVRAYVSRLDAALPELFFFVRTEEPTFTLKVFAFCLTNASWEDGRSTLTVTRKLLLDTDNLAAFLERHFLGLNEMTDWLGMSIEENMKISQSVAKCLGYPG